MSVNKQILVGRLGADPELRFTPAGRAVCNFNVATDNVWIDKEGVKQKATTWHRIVIWGKRAEAAAKYLNKGKEVYLEGRTDHRSWEDKDGVKKYITEVVVSDFVFVGTKGGSGVPGVSDENFQGRDDDDFNQQHPSDESGGVGGNLDPDDVPF